MKSRLKRQMLLFDPSDIGFGNATIPNSLNVALLAWRDNFHSGFKYPIDSQISKFITQQQISDEEYRCAINSCMNVYSKIDSILLPFENWNIEDIQVIHYSYTTVALLICGYGDRHVTTNTC